MPTHKIGDTDYFYEERGKGMPLVLLHGFPLSHGMWNPQITDLSSVARVIAPDFRGFGRSKSEAVFTIDSLADDIHQLLAGIGALPCVVAGLSMGGYVALAFARKYTVDLNGLVLIDTRADADSPQAKESRQKNIDLVRQNGAPAIADAMIPRLLSPGADEGRPELARSLRQMIEAGPASTIERALVALRDRADSTAALSKIGVPTLILVGDNDQITPLELSEKMQQAVAGSKVTIIRGAGHMSSMEQPAQVNQALRQFMQKLQGKR
jgi:pimeloyl-ACP methyl ester carboxylesterase